MHAGWPHVFFLDGGPPFEGLQDSTSPEAVLSLEDHQIHVYYK